MTAPVPHPGLSAEELLVLPGESGRAELVKGTVVHMTPAGARQGAVTARIGRLLDEHVEAHGFGVCRGAETGFVLRRAPDTVRPRMPRSWRPRASPPRESRPPTGPAPPIWPWRWFRRGIDPPKSRPGSRSTSTPARDWSGLWSPSSARSGSAGRRTTFGCSKRTTTSTAATCCRGSGARCDAFFHRSAAPLTGRPSCPGPVEERVLNLTRRPAVSSDRTSAAVLAEERVLDLTRRPRQSG